MSDAERSAVQERLHRAHDAGQIQLEEFDQRVRSAWAARTRGELERVTTDLPDLPDPSGRRPVFSPTAGGTAMRVLTIVWASVATLNLVVWGIVVVTTGELVHPWWLWVAAPPGAVLGVLYAAGIGRPDRGPA